MPAADRPRVVVFGRRGAGKSAFVTAAGRCEPSVEFVDTDGAADERDLASGAVTDAVSDADAVVLTLDAAEDGPGLVESIKVFHGYLAAVSRHLTDLRAVDGRPVAVVLTKCDTLLTRGDTLAEWRSRISTRVAAAEAAFERTFPTDADPRFGRVMATVFATGTTAPAIAGAPRDGTGGFGLAAAARHAAAAAAAHRRRARRSDRRVVLLVAAAILGVLAFVAGSVASGLVPGTDHEDRLVGLVRKYQVRERATAVRLSEARRPRTKAELASIRGDAGFANLPEDLRVFVITRWNELERYDEYAKRFRRPAPADLRNAEELDRLAAALRTDLAPPPADATAWAETEAVRLREKWATDIDLLRPAEARLHDWHRGLTRRANDLWFAPAPDRSWRADVSAAFAEADSPPFKPDDVVPGSDEVPVAGGQKLTYATAYECDRVYAARREWEFCRDRLARTRDLADAVGFTESGGPVAGLLDFADLPVAATDFERFAAERLATLRAAMPSLLGQPTLYAMATLPDSNREEFRKALDRATTLAVRRIRERVRSAVLAAGHGKETPDAWRAVSPTVLAEPWLTDWGQLLALISALIDDAPVNPVGELRTFVGRATFDVNADAWDVTVPDSLRPERFVPEATMTVTAGPATLHFDRVGDERVDRGERTFRFRAGPTAANSP